MYNNIKYLKNNRCGKFQSLTDMDKGSSVLKDEVCTASGAVLFFCGTHLFAKSTACLAKTFSTGSQGENQGSGS